MNGGGAGKVYFVHERIWQCTDGYVGCHFRSDSGGVRSLLLCARRFGCGWQAIKHTSLTRSPMLEHPTPPLRTADQKPHCSEREKRGRVPSISSTEASILSTSAGLMRVAGRNAANGPRPPHPCHSPVAFGSSLRSCWAGLGCVGREATGHHTVRCGAVERRPTTSNGGRLPPATHKV